MCTAATFRKHVLPRYKVGNLFLETHFWPMIPFLYPLKTPGNQRFSGVFRRYTMKILAKNGLIQKLSPFSRKKKIKNEISF